ncbi:MAG: hypothetical protein AB7R69_02715 [Candidatus Babeliales bacterium]
MTIVNHIKEFIEQLDEAAFKRYIVTFFALFFLCIGFIIYRYYSGVSVIKNRIDTINKKRKEVKNLLERFEVVKVQKTEVDTLLEKDAAFKIGGYFDTIINQLGIAGNQTRAPETSSEELDNGYTEVKLYASFTNMNTQKLVALLDTLEQNERIYTKEVEIYKPDVGKTININILIATLEPKIETTEITE